MIDAGRALLALYWLAGILEGEGSFMAGPPSDPRRPRISVQMTDEDIIERVAALWRVAYVRQTDRRNPAWKPVFSAQLRGGRAVELMRILRPIMGARRQQQIDRAIASYVPSRTPLAADDRKTIRAMLRQGSTVSAIARAFSASRKTIRRVRES